MERPLVEFLLDSVILIDRFNKVPEARRYVAETRGKAAISVVTVAEALVGFSATSQAVAARSLDRFPLLDITGPVANLAATLRRKQGWKLPDAFQAALAQHHDLKLVTPATKTFRRSVTALLWYRTCWRQRVRSLAMRPWPSLRGQNNA